jgi:hypothetical protein
MVFKLTNIDDPMERLKRAIVIVTEKIVDDERTEHVNERILNRIVIIEFTKTLYTKEVDEENKEGYFIIYKRLINRMVEIVNEINPDYPLQKFDFNHCKRFFTPTFFKRTLINYY